MTRYIGLLGMIVGMLCLPVSVGSTIWHAHPDSAVNTIQAGIDSASDTDTVLVYPETYVENINFNGKNIVVGSLFLMTGDTSYISSTVIDGDSAGSVVTFRSGEDSSAVITGFAIENGFSAEGGGILCFHSSPSISRCTITRNRAGAGCGISCISSNPTITYSIITENVDSFAIGGGFLCYENSNPTLTHVIITRNVIPFDGGGIMCYNSHLTLTDVAIEENAAWAGPGGGIVCSESDLKLTNVSIAGNDADWGGGIYSHSSRLSLTNVAVTGNTADLLAGGIFCDGDGASATLSNVTISDNSRIGMRCDPCTLTLVNSILWNNIGDELRVHDSSVAEVAYSDIQGGWEGEGNIDCDPLFCYPDTGNYYLAENSCCIGTGQNGGDIGAFGIGCPPFALLECSLWAKSDTVLTGDSIYVYMGVENTGGAYADSVIPFLRILGNGKVSLESGPDPPYVDMEDGSDTTFCWTYTAQGSGVVWWTGYASGRDRNTQLTVSSPRDTSNQVRIIACGDCNGDGRITFADALYLKNYCYQTPPGFPAPIGQGDVNLDGRITAADALYIKNYYYQTPPGSPPPCEPPL